MEIGEAIAVLVTPEGDDPCPFCSSKADPVFETKVMVNDSAALARSLGGMPGKTMRHPEADFDVFENYYVSEQVSRICFNAHHIIPGNAALGRCPEILEWMAGTTTIKKKFYDQAIAAKVKKVHSSKADSTRAALVAAKFPSSTIFGDPEMTITFSTPGGLSAIHRDKTVSTNKVTGKIDFEVNDARNGVWLPSNNAVDGWAVMAAEMAIDIRKRERVFPQAYAYNAMRVSKKQFHDAHEPYSAEVVDKLKQIAMELRKLASACLSHEDTPSQEDGPFPAPQRLSGALYKLANMIDHQKLDCTVAKPAAPWVTSELSTLVGEKF